MTDQAFEHENEHPWRWVPAGALKTRRALFLGEMDRLLPWARWVDLIEPHYPKRGNGRPPYPLAPMLRLYMVQQWWKLSDRAAQEWATDSVAVRHFMGLPLTWDKGAPDESTFASFRRMLARRGLAVEIATEAAAAIDGQGWKLRPGENTEPAIMATAI